LTDMDTLEKLEEKINRVLALIERLTEENKTLKSENESLKRELSETKSRLSKVESLDLERSEKMKGKLNNILEKLGALEQI